MKKKKLRCSRCGNEFFSDKPVDVCDVCGSLAFIVEESWEILFSYFKPGKKFKSEKQ